MVAQLGATLPKDYESLARTGATINNKNQTYSELVNKNPEDSLLIVYDYIERSAGKLFERRESG